MEIPKPLPIERGPGGSHSLDQAAEMIAAAEFPVIISGGGVVMADGVEECKRELAKLGEVNGDRLAKLQDFYVAKGFIQKATPVAELYTNEFVK